MPTVITSLINSSQHHSHHRSSVRCNDFFVSSTTASSPAARSLTMTSPGSSPKLASSSRGPGAHSKNMMILRIPGPLDDDSGTGTSGSSSSSSSNRDDVKEAAALISACRDSAPASPPLRHHPHLHHPHLHHHRFHLPGSDHSAADSTGIGHEHPLSLRDPVFSPFHAGKLLALSGDGVKDQFDNNNTTSRGADPDDDTGKERRKLALPTSGDDDDDNTTGRSDDPSKTSSSSIPASLSSTLPQTAGSDTKTILVISKSRESDAEIDSESAVKNFEGCDSSSSYASETSAATGGVGEVSTKGREDSVGSDSVSSGDCASRRSEIVSPSSGDGAGGAFRATPTTNDNRENASGVPSSEPEIVSVLKRKDSKKRDGVGRSVSVTAPSGTSDDAGDAETLPNVSSKRRISFPADSVLTAVIQDGDAGELLRILTGRHGPGLVAGETGRGVDVQQSNHVGLTALHHAVLANNLDAAKLLLCHGADVNAQDVHGFSPLHTAAACGFLPLASLLVLFGADVFSLTSECELPVDLARDVEVVRVLTSEMTRLLHQELWLTSLLRARAEEAWLLVRKLLACILLFVLYVVMGLKSSWSRRRSKTD